MIDDCITRLPHLTLSTDVIKEVVEDLVTLSIAAFCLSSIRLSNLFLYIFVIVKQVRSIKFRLMRLCFKLG